MSTAWQHRTVLLTEAIDALVTDAAGVYVDGTFGRGGHSRLLLSRLSPAGRVIALDRDLEAVAAASGMQASDARFSILHANFADLREALASLGISKVNGVLLDLGVSSPQIDNPARGFSFRFDAPLDMRMDTTRGESAADFLARADERTLTEVIKDYGEERFARQIAKALVARREGGHAIRTTARPFPLVARAVSTREAGPAPGNAHVSGSTDSRQRELEELEQGLNAALEILAPGGVWS